MPHAILTGDPERIAELRPRLLAEGLTATMSPAGTPVATDLDVCDVVIWAPASGTGEHGAVAGVSGHEAPVLAVGAMFPGAPVWRHLSWDAARGDEFSEALHACLTRAVELRDPPESTPTMHRFREFLGHELRSPLTAIKTALEAVVDDPGDGTPGDPGLTRMLEIALRNTYRLERTVEWNHQMLELADAPPVCARRAVTVAELGGHLSEHFEVAVADTGAVLETDPLLAGAVVVQLVRALEYARPGAEDSVQLTAEGESCVITLGKGCGEATGPRVARMGLESPHRDCRGNEIRDLVDFLVPSSALAALGAELTVGDGPNPPLTLRLPLAVSVLID